MIKFKVKSPLGVSDFYDNTRFIWDFGVEIASLKLAFKVILAFIQSHLCFFTIQFIIRLIRFKGVRGINLFGEYPFEKDTS